MSITPRLLERFSRQILLPEIGVEGLRKLRRTRVAVLGCGATGTAQAEVLARIGIGYIRVVDRDYVDYSNLPRTRLFTEEDADKALPKAVACAEKLKEIDPSIEVESVIEKITSENIEELIRDVDIVVDGLDNLHTRFVVNDACVKLGKPWVFTGFASWYGNTILIHPEKGPCLRCIVPVKMLEREHRENACDILGAVYPSISLLTSISTTLILKHILGLTTQEDYRRFYVVDGKKPAVEEILIHKNPECPTCSLRRFEFLESKEEKEAARICGSSAVEIEPPTRIPVLNLEEIADRLRDKYEVVSINPYTAKIRINDFTYMVLFNNGRAIIDGLTNVEEAKKIYEEVFSAIKHVLHT